MLKRLLLSVSLLITNKVAFATEPLGFEEFMRAQQAGQVNSNFRHSMLKDFAMAQEEAFNPIEDDEDPFGEELRQLAANTNAQGEDLEKEAAPTRYTPDQKAVLRVLFVDKDWFNPAKRKMRGGLAQNLLYKLEIIETKRPKTNGEMLRLVNESKEKSVTRGNITNFLNTYNTEPYQWIEYEQGKKKGDEQPIRLTPRGRYALEVLREEEAEGRQQPVTYKRESAPYTNNKPVAKKLTGAAKLVDDILQPTSYVSLLSALEDGTPRTKDEIHGRLWERSQGLKHYTSIYAVAISKGFIQVKDPEAGTTVITPIGLEALPLLKAKTEKLAAAKQKNDAAFEGDEEAGGEAPKVDLKKLMNPLMHYLVLQILSEQKGPLKVQKIIEKVRELYPKYKGTQLEVKDITIRDSYIRKQEREFKWVVARKESGGFSYVISAAGREYLEPLSRKAESIREGAGLKRPSPRAQNDVEQIVAPGDLRQERDKRRKSDTSE